jgi:hypothetical protein
MIAAARCALMSVLLLCVIAVWSQRESLECHLAIIGKDRVHGNTEVDGVDDIRLEYISPISMAPHDGNTGFVSDFDSFGFDKEARRNLSVSTGANNDARGVNFLPRLGEILTIWDAPIEIMHRTPSDECSGSCASIIMKIKNYLIGGWSAGDECNDSGGLNNGAQLLASIGLDMGGHFILPIGDQKLLVNEPVGNSRDDNQASGEHADAPRPPSDIAMGVVLVLAGSGLVGWGVWHAGPPPSEAALPLDWRGL